MSYLIALFTFLLPICFFPSGAISSEFAKLLFLYGGVVLLFIFWAIETIRNKRFIFSSSSFYLPIFLLVLTFGASTLFSAARFNSFLGALPHLHWNFIEVCALILFFVSAVNNLDKKGMVIVKKSLIASCIFLALWTFLSFFVFNSLTISFFTVNFSLPLTPIDSLTTLFVFLLVTAPFILEWIKENLSLIVNKQAKIYHGIFLGLSILALVLVVFIAFLASPWTRSLTNKIVNIELPQVSSLDIKPSWLVTATTIRDAPIFGSGPGTFLLDFTRYRPFLMLTNEGWADIFVKPANELFEIISTLGIVGFFVFVFLFYRMFSKYKERKSWAVFGSVLVLLLTMFFTPTTVSSGFLFFLLLIILSVETNKEGTVFAIDFSEKFRTIPYFLLGASLIFGGLIFYSGKRAYLAQSAFSKSFEEAAQNNIVETYNLQQEAIVANPYIDDYHRVYAQTNLALMSGLAVKEGLTDEEKGTIQALVQQVVRESKIVTENLSPNDSRNWALRGDVYRTLIGAAEGADQWAIDAYQQAVFLDPLNLYLRINLGGVFYGLNDFETAERIFRAAVQLKPDFANARFNFAASLREQGKKEEAIQQLELVKSLVEEDSIDAQRVEEELEKLRGEE